MPPNGPFYRHDTTEDTEAGGGCLACMATISFAHAARNCADVPRYSTAGTALASIRSTTRPRAAATSADSTTRVNDAAAAETTTVSTPMSACTTALVTTATRMAGKSERPTVTIRPPAIRTRCPITSMPRELDVPRSIQAG